MTLSLLAWVGSGAAVERFECALSLLPARCVGGWIVGAGENGALGAVAELGGRIGGSGHSNGAQRIVNLLFWLCNALITNDDSTNYPLLIAAGGRRGGAGAGFDRGGGERARAIGSILTIHQRLQNLFPLPQVAPSKIGLQKKGARAAHSTNTRHAAHDHE